MTADTLTELTAAVEYVLPIDIGDDARRRRIAELAAGSILAAGWRPPARTVTTVEERDALPAGVVVHAAGGTIACRHHSGVGVVFGDDRPFPWNVLALPLTVLHEGGEPQ